MMGMRDAAMTRRQESVFHCSDSRKLIASDADADRGPADLVHKHTRRACGVGYVELVNWFTHPKPVPVPVRLGILSLSVSHLPSIYALGLQFIGYVYARNRYIICWK